MPKIVTRAYALKNGINRFFTGVPCKRGHVCLRQTSNSQCTECRNEYRNGKGHSKYLKYISDYSRRTRAAYREARDRRLKQESSSLD